jgi:hypothetical protein
MIAFVVKFAGSCYISLVPIAHCQFRLFVNHSTVELAYENQVLLFVHCLDAGLPVRICCISHG